MSEYRKNLVDRVIRLYGFEDERVVAFANLCERHPDSVGWDKVLWMLVMCHEQAPVIDEE